jgi:hypothetical protein
VSVGAPGRAAGARPGEDAAAWEAAGLVLLAALGLSRVARPSSRPGERRAAARALAASGRRRLSALGAALVAGDVALDAWRRAMLADVRARSAAASLAIAGAPRLGPAGRRELAGLVGRQAWFLGRFRAQVAAGSVPMDGRVAARAGMYADATWSVAMGVDLAERKAAGYREAMRVLGAARHCDPCVALAGYWTPVWQVAPIGDTPCGARCHCYIEYR